MAAARRNPPRVRGDTTRRKLEVASAMAWEALVEAHVEQALHFIELVTRFQPVEQSLPRYLREMDVDATMATAIRTRVLTGVEEEPPIPPDDLFGDTPFPYRGQVGQENEDRWSLLWQPQRVVRGVIRRQKRSEAFDRIAQLALARAEEHVIRAHIENAIGFVALLEDLPFERAIENYLASVGVSGGRAQTVFQRTMARLADVHLGKAGGSATE